MFDDLIIDKKKNEEYTERCNGKCDICSRKPECMSKSLESPIIDYRKVSRYTGDPKNPIIRRK